jgi:fucose 4-O-acetylase-like acetyltransferase
MSARSEERLVWLDAARGIGVTLVVFGHVWRGLESARILRDQPLFEIVDSAIYLFHMPLFFLLSGLTFAGTARRTPPGVFLHSRGWRLLYPMVIWTYILLFFRVLFSAYSNRDIGFADMLRLPLPPYELFWFLWALLLAQMLVYALLRGLPGHTGMAAVVATGIGALLFRQDLPILHEWLNGMLRSLPPFALGVVLGERMLSGRGVPKQGWAAAAGFALCLALHLAFDTTGAVRLMLGMTAALCCTAAIRATFGASGSVSGLDSGLVAGVGARSAVSLAAGAAAGWLRIIGAASMAIFLTHVLFAGMLRSALAVAGIRDIWLQAGLGTAIGLIGPLIALHMARRLNLARLAGF